MKYAMFQVFCIPTEEMSDPDAETPPASTPVKEDQKPAPAPKHAPAQAPRFVCEECGHELRPYLGSDGKLVSLRAHAERSKNKFGKVLCIDCIKKNG